MNPRRIRLELEEVAEWVRTENIYGWFSEQEFIRTLGEAFSGYCLGLTDEEFEDLKVICEDPIFFRTKRDMDREYYNIWKFSEKRSISHPEMYASRYDEVRGRNYVTLRCEIAPRYEFIGSSKYRSLITIRVIKGVENKFSVHIYHKSMGQNSKYKLRESYDGVIYDEFGNWFVTGLRNRYR